MIDIMRGFKYSFNFDIGDGKVEKGAFFNIIPDQGVEYLSSLILGAGPVVPSWYIGLIGSDYIPNRFSKASDIPTSMSEITTIAQASRPQWMGVFDKPSMTLTNKNSEAKFDLETERTIYGAFIVSSSTKGDGGGILLSVGRFSTPRALPAGSKHSCWAEIPLIAPAI